MRREVLPLEGFHIDITVDSGSRPVAVFVTDRPRLDYVIAFARFADEVTEGGLRIALGTIVGMATGYPAERHFASSDEPLTVAPGNRLRRRVGLAILRRRWWMMGHPRRGEFYVEFLIVDSDRRGMVYAADPPGSKPSRRYVLYMTKPIWRDGEPLRCRELTRVQLRWAPLGQGRSACRREDRCD